MSYTPKGLGHINIYVRNAERSREWYEDVLGLHTYDLRPDAAFMTANKEVSHEIALVQVGDDAPGPERGRVGLNHMAWYMESLEDLEELYMRMKEKNVPIDRVANHGVSIGIYLRDPDGNGIEVSYEQPRSEWPREDKLFTDIDSRPGRFPGAWDEDLKKAAAR